MRVGKTLVIVGSGPVGMVAALLLKDRFERVVLLERQSEERFLRTRGFTFPIVFSPAAIAVLKRAGAWEAISAERSPYFGVVVHAHLFGREFTWTSKREGVFSHWRNHIIASLYDRVLESGLEVVFGADVRDIDFDSNVCTEATLGRIPFDLLLGADGVNSITRRFMADAHPAYVSEEFRSMLLDRWYAYRLSSLGALADRFGGGDEYHAAHVFVDNHPRHPHDKVRLITVAMKEPREEISVVVKYAADVSLDRVRHINDLIIRPLIDSGELDREWNSGIAGEYSHVAVPTFCLNSALLVGDAAHAFEGNGDLINLGITSVGALADALDRSSDIPQTIADYDETTGAALRVYSEHAFRRSMEKIDFEIAAFELGAMLGLSKHHPSMWGIYEDDFEIESLMEYYQRQRRRFGTAARLASGLSMLGVLAWLRSRVQRERSPS